MRDATEPEAGMSGQVDGDEKASASALPYRALIDAMDTAVLLMHGPAVVTCNPATARLFGIDTPEAMVGKTPLDFAPTHQPNGMTSAQMVQDNIIQANARGTHAFEWLTTKIDGQAILLEVRFTMLAGTDGMYLCTATDISERKRAEQDLRESEERFRTLFESALEGILVADVESRRFIIANPAICEILGYEHGELVGLGVPDIHPPENMAAVEAAFERHIHSPEQFEVETVCRRKDGSHIPVAVRSAPLELAGHRYVAGFFTDTTSRRQLDEERLKVQKLDAIGTLAGGIAHDFNNLLQGVFGFIALSRLAQDDKPRSLAMLAQAEKALQQAVHLTTQLLTFSKGGQPIKKSLELAPFIQSAATFALSGSRADCRFAIEDNLASVDADEGQLTQVMQNIVLNAAQAMPQGGTVQIAARNVDSPNDGVPPQLPAGRFVAITIRDSGVGIPMRYLSKIFDPYFTTKDRGTGLGLATSYAIVKNHGGIIDVHSTTGNGSTFTIYLPVSDVPVTDSSPLEADEARPGRLARILVMDDDPVVLEVVAMLLRSLGHDVDMAEDGAAAVDVYQHALSSAAPHDIVLLDLTVRGGVGGVEAAELLRELNPSVKVVLTSGYSDEIAAVEPGRHGVCAFLKKPFDLETLRTTVDDILRSTDPSDR
jgi:PAS domain S-box-containing protein